MEFKIYEEGEFSEHTVACKCECGEVDYVIARLSVFEERHEYEYCDGLKLRCKGCGMFNEIMIAIN